MQQIRSMEVIKRRRILTVAHLHPSDPERCAEEMEGLDINNTEILMCLDPAFETEPCAVRNGLTSKPLGRYNLLIYS